MIWIDRKFIGEISHLLRNFSWKKQDLAVFACPLCGDSQKNRSKRRGYFFRKKNDMFFHCFNCGVNTTLPAFLKQIDPDAHRRYSLEVYKEKNNKTPAVVVNPIFKTKNPIEKKSQKSPSFTDDGIFTRLDALDPKHIAVKYCENRLLPKDSYKRIFFLNDMRKLSKILPKYSESFKTEEPRIIFPFTNREGDVTGLTARSIIDSKLRYVTLKIRPEEPCVFGLSRVNFNEYIFVTEGPIDSLFLPNSLSVSGSGFGKIKDLIPKERTTLIYDNEPRSPEITRLMEQMVDKGWNMFFWPGGISAKDINEAVIKKEVPQEKETFSKFIRSHSYSGIRAKLMMTKWRKK